MRDALTAAPPWLGGGTDRDVVVCCRARFSRNLGDMPFPWRSSVSEATELRERLTAAVKRAAPDSASAFLEDLSAVEAAAAAERGWMDAVSAADFARAVIVADAGSSVFSVNETDHLRITGWASGNEIDAAYGRARAYEEALDAELGWAATVERGYLTSRVEDAGAALRLTALVFVPGILAAGVFERVARGLLTSGVEPHLRSGGESKTKPWTEGEAFASPTSSEGGTAGIGDQSRLSPYLELSARVPFGVREEDTAAAFKKTLFDLAEGERRTRERLLVSRRAEFEDAAFRAAGLLRSARLLEAKEARGMLAELRAGIAYGVAPAAAAAGAAAPAGAEDPYAAIDAALFLCGKGAPRLTAAARGLPSEEGFVNGVRAELVRGALPRYDM